MVSISSATLGQFGWVYAPHPVICPGGKPARITPVPCYLIRLILWLINLDSAEDKVDVTFKSFKK
jgi:hypothetical protein